MSGKGKKIFLNGNPSNGLGGDQPLSALGRAHNSTLNRFRCDYFLEKVFNNLEKKKTLNIVKYNKNIRNRINININDYKEYAEKYSSIEIEIIPVNNEYGQFINYKLNIDDIYHHIYFNNNKEEIKRNYINKDEDIKIIRLSS